MGAPRTLALIIGIATPFIGCGRSFIDALDLGDDGSVDGPTSNGHGASDAHGSSSGGVASSGGSSDASGADATDHPPLDAPADAPWIPTLHACTFFTPSQQPPPPAGPVVASCSGVTLSNPVITGPEGGPLTGGTQATLTVLVHTTRSDINTTPCLGLSSDNSDVTFGQGGPVLFALVPSQQGQTFTYPVTFGAAIAPGTVVRFAAWLVWKNTGGSPDASDPTCTGGLTEWSATVN
jgi:hypothetical protein